MKTKKKKVSQAIPSDLRLDNNYLLIQTFWYLRCCLLYAQRCSWENTQIWAYRISNVCVMYERINTMYLLVCAFPLFRFSDIEPSAYETFAYILLFCYDDEIHWRAFTIFINISATTAVKLSTTN